MFNTYAVRPIGSETFLEHLKDIQVRSFYDTVFPFNAAAEVHGTVPWGSHDASNPYVCLATAIIANAMLEYLHYYKQKEHFLDIHDDRMYWAYNSRCIQMENDYFRRNKTLERLFDLLLENVCWEGIYEIERCQRRIRNVLRWTKKAERTHEND